MKIIRMRNSGGFWLATKKGEAVLSLETIGFVIFLFCLLGWSLWSKM